MQCAAYLFLEREYEKDAITISDMITYYKDMGRHYQVDFSVMICCLLRLYFSKSFSFLIVCVLFQILLFPEGTDRGDRAVKRSDKFATQHGLPIYRYVLHPRTSGFTCLVQVMRQS